MTLKQESVHLGAFPKQCIKIAGVFLNRVLCILAFFCPKQSGLQTLISSSPLPKYWLDKRGMVWEKARKIEGLSQHLCNLLSFSHRHKPLAWARASVHLKPRWSPVIIMVTDRSAKRSYGKMTRGL